MNSKSYIRIPTCNIFSGVWDYREFETKEDYISFVQSHFKLPGKYNLKYTHVWKELATKFDNSSPKRYQNFVKKSRDYIKFWDFEKEKCRYNGGVIYWGREKKDGEVHSYEYFVPGLFYFYLNYCIIFDKLEKVQKFPNIWDSDLHFFIYILLCILKGKHALVVKKRQAGYTYKHIAILLNTLWFNGGFTNKIFAQDKTHVENSWAFMANFRNHLNRHTGWYRNFNPDKTLEWKQQVQVEEEGKKVFKGNMSVLKGFTTEKDPAKGVGGANSFVYGEESGMNDTLHITHQYLLPATQLGNVTTGLVMYSGSVGELEKCGPLKTFFYNPEINGFLGVENIWDDDNQRGKQCGFFVPEEWNYPHFIDEDGNSDVEGARKVIDQEKEKQKGLGTEPYRLYCSQHPSSPGEAFAFRKESIFPVYLIKRQMTRIEQQKLYGIPTDLYMDENGNIKDRISSRTPVSEFPCRSGDKEGVVMVWERPSEKPKWGEYFAAVDPVVEGKTETSDSLFSVYIYKNLVEVTKEKDGKVEKNLEGDEIVACWTGRFDDVKKTNERAEMLIEWYNAMTIVENNVTSFIQHMITKKKQKYLLTKHEIPFIKELHANKSVFQEYGIKMTEVIKTFIFSSVVEYLKEEIGVLHDNDGKELSKILGVSRIKDTMLLREMEVYEDKMNVDRIIAFGLVLALARSRQINGLITRREERTTTKVEKNLYIINKPLFTRIERGISKGGFKNLK